MCRCIPLTQSDPTLLQGGAFPQLRSAPWACTHDRGTGGDLVVRCCAIQGTPRNAR